MIKAYLTDTITIRKYTGKDKYQAASARVDEVVKGRVDYKERLIPNIEGNTVVSSAKVMLELRTIITSGFSTRVKNTISYHDLITINGVDRKVVTIATATDFRTRYIMVYVT